MVNSSRKALKCHSKYKQNCETIWLIVKICVHFWQNAQSQIFFKVVVFVNTHTSDGTHTTCLSCNKALNVFSLDWSQGWLQWSTKSQLTPRPFTPLPSPLSSLSPSRHSLQTSPNACIHHRRATEWGLSWCSQSSQKKHWRKKKSEDQINVKI